MPYRFFPLHEEEAILNRLHILMEDYGVYVTPDSLDMRSLVYLSDKTVKLRNDMKQRMSMARQLGAR